MGRFAVVFGIFLGLSALNVSASEQDVDWVTLSRSEIGETLSDRKLVYDGATQVFYASGRTLYNAGRDSWGYWQVRGDSYCSQWPPSGLWDCYQLDIGPAGQLRFVGSGGSFSTGVFAE
jgi:hypothetical protein